MGQGHPVVKWDRDKLQWSGTGTSQGEVGQGQLAVEWNRGWMPGEGAHMLRHGQLLPLWSGKWKTVPFTSTKMETPTAAVNPVKQEPCSLHQEETSVGQKSRARAPVTEQEFKKKIPRYGLPYVLHDPHALPCC